MIQKLSHATVYVLDQDEAYDFYVNKLGFDVKTDVKMDGGFRWLTVSPKGQPDLEIVLMSLAAGGFMDEETTAQLRELVAQGKMGTGVFATADCRKTYEELRAKGVHFTKEPTEEFYGVEAVFQDNSGNWFSLTQQKK